MPLWFENLSALMGRVLLGGFFLWTGILNAINFPETAAVFGALQLPHPVWIAILAIAVEVCAGAALVAGTYVRASALWLALYLLIMTPIVHRAFGNPQEINLFLQNMALVGALLYIAAKA
ncbi:MAG TPA: DoxX family protein [Candidatus Paceibacterota bacterium]